MPQQQGGGTQYTGGPGSSMRGPLYIKGAPGGSGQYSFYQIFDQFGQLASNVIVPSANLDPQVIQYLKVTLTAAQVKALHGTPVTLIAAPGAGKFIQLIDALIYLNFNTTGYAAGSAVNIVDGGATVATTTAALINTGSAIAIQPGFPLVGTTNSVGTGNSALTITAASSEFTTGDSPVDVHLWYAVVTL